MRWIWIWFLPLWLFAKMDYSDALEVIVDLNIKTYNERNQANYTQEVVQNSKKKLRTMKQIVAMIASQEKIESFTQDALVGALQNEIQSNAQIQNSYLVALKSIELHTLLAQKLMFEVAQEIQRKNSFFTTHTQIRNLLQNDLEKLKAYDEIPQNDLTSTQKDQLKPQLQRLEVVLDSYIEVLSYLQYNLNLILPQSLWTNFNLSWVLQKIDSLFPEDFQHPLVGKGILSLMIFALLFVLRNVLSGVIIRCIGYLARFLQAKDLQCKIKAQIASPVLWLVLILSTYISADILFYPSAVPLKLGVWLNATLIVVCSWLVILLFRGYGTALLGSIAQKNQDTFRREVINLLLKILYFTIVLIGILALLKNFGFNVSAIVASLGIGGLAVALAIKDMLANFFASVVLLFDNSFNQGDWVVCGKIEGTIVEMGLRRTTIRTFDNAMLFVPNSLLANECVRNWSRRKVGRRIKLQIGVEYGATQEQLTKCINEIKTMLLNHPKIAKASDERAPLTHYEIDLRKDIVSLDDLLGYKSDLFVVLDEFAGSSINILVYCFSTSVKWLEWLDVKQDVMLKIMGILKENGLSFAFPSQSVYVESLPELKLNQGSLENLKV